MNNKELVRALGSSCALHRLLFDPQLLLSQHAPPYGPATLVTAGRALGFLAEQQPLALRALRRASARGSSRSL